MSETEQSETELLEANQDLAYWRNIFDRTGWQVVGWTYQSSVQVRKDNDYVNFDAKQVRVLLDVKAVR